MGQLVAFPITQQPVPRTEQQRFDRMAALNPGWASGILRGMASCRRELAADLRATGVGAIVADHHDRTADIYVRLARDFERGMS